MKKAIGIIILGLMWCDVGFTKILFKDCVSNNKDGTFRKFEEGKKHEYYINLNEKKIYRVKVRDLEMIRSLQEYEGKHQELVDRLLKSGRVKNTEYQITFDDSELVTGKRLEQDTTSDNNWRAPYYLTEEISINLKDNTIEYLQTRTKIPKSFFILVTGEIKFFQSPIVIRPRCNKANY